MQTNIVHKKKTKHENGDDLRPVHRDLIKVVLLKHLNYK